jgi:hypothetical protein
VLYADNHSIEIIEITDIVHGQFQDALIGVDAVIHTASPLPGRASPQEMLNVCGFRPRHSFEIIKLIFLKYWQSAIEGSLNVLRQAEKAGVKKFVVTSSLVAVMRDPAVKGTAYRSERRLFHICVLTFSITYSSSYRLESSDQGGSFAQRLGRESQVGCL